MSHSSAGSVKMVCFQYNKRFLKETKDEGGRKRGPNSNAKQRLIFSSHCVVEFVLMINKL